MLRLLTFVAFTAALVAAPAREAAAQIAAMAVLVPPPGLQPFADLTPAFPKREPASYMLDYVVQSRSPESVATLVGSIGSGNFDQEIFYDATLRYNECMPDAAYCARTSMLGGSPHSELFRGLQVNGSRAFATHIICCNGHYWQLMWYDERVGMTYQLSFKFDIADRYSVQAISEGNITGAQALVDTASQLVPLR